MIAESPRIPSLDGLRALAVVTVLLIHVQQRYALIPSLTAGPDGVELFFVLSGFLITTMLLRDAERAGGPRLGRFYLRRATRILPPLLVYLGAIASLSLGTGHPVPWEGLGASALFLTNLVPQAGDPVFTQHLWSLAVEEQFYLLWPVLLFAALTAGGRRAAGRVCLALIAAGPVFRMAAAWAHLPLFEHHQSIMLPGRMDSLCAGALLAIASGSPAAESLYRRCARFIWAAPLFFLVLSPLLRAAFGNNYTFTVGFTVESLAAAFFLGWLLRNPHARTSRALGWRPIALLGMASYSVYLYQSAILFLWPVALGGRHPAFVLAIAVAAGLLAYAAVELPVERLRGRGSVRVLRSTAAEPAALAAKSA